MAYRGTAEGRRIAPQGGLIEEVVQQFADRFAYARELVQNSIDAGAKAILVRVESSMEELTVSFEDDGTGMSLETIEGSLLTLFSSTKEHASNAIGRYGVGFKSVLAVDPSLVLVETRHASGSFVVELRRDHTFEVKEGTPGSKTGTVVRLILPPGVAHVRELRRALFGWCRHVRCPITLSTDGVREVVNVPFTLTGPVVLEAREEELHVLVAIDGPNNRSPHDPQGSFAGFYSHGLTLLETTSRDPARAGVSFKVESRALACTISRDDVRRDKVFRAAMKLVDRLVEHELPAALEQNLKREATVCGELGALSPAYFELVAAAAPKLAPDRVAVPLAEARTGRPIGSLAGLRTERAQLFSASGRSLLTAHVASLGHAIVLDAPDASLGRWLQLPLTKIDEQFSVVTEIDPPPALRVVLRLVAETLRAALGHPVEIACVGESSADRSEGRPRAVGVFVLEPAAANPRRWVLPPPKAEHFYRLLLPASEALSALERAKDPVSAANLFARLVLLECTRAGVDARTNELLLARSAEIPS